MHSARKEKAGKISEQVSNHLVNNIVLVNEVIVKVEANLVIQALRVNTMSKLTFSDSIRFDSLVKDVVPGVELQNVVFEHLKAALMEAATELNYIINDNQVNKGKYF